MVALVQPITHPKKTKKTVCRWSAVDWKAKTIQITVHTTAQPTL
jgi:hypothetical protein